MPYQQMGDLELPSDLQIPTCDGCGADFIDRRTAKRVDAALEAAYQRAVSERARLDVETIARSMPQRDLERLIGVSVGYLSKIKSGKEISGPLASLLGLLASDSRRLDELRRLWAAGRDRRPPEAEDGR
jgi:hypothetical protein